jgi:hypothetical protein
MLYLCQIYLYITPACIKQKIQLTNNDLLK